jgi:CRP/FNR family transcriptional regulator, cyclic AMP receptor protein
VKEELLPPAALASIETRKAYPEGYEFFAPGEPASGIYILYGGRARLTLVDREGGELTLGFAEPGDILGLSAAVTGRRHEERAEATLPCQAGFIKGRDFLQFLDHHPEAAFWTVQLLSNRVAAAFEHLSSVRGIPPRRIT